MFFVLLNDGSFAVLKASKIFRSILEMLGNSQGDPQKSYEELGIFGSLRLNQFVSSLTADHYFWCSGGVPGCFEGLPGYYGMSQGWSGGVPGFTDTLFGD